MKFPGIIQIQKKSNSYFFPIKAKNISENDMKCGDKKDLSHVIARERSSSGSIDYNSRYTFSKNDTRY